MNLRRRRRRRRILLLLALAVLALVLLIPLRFFPLVRTLVRVKLDNEVSGIIVDAIDAQLEEGTIRYEQIIRLQTDESGNVTALTTDMAEVNRLKLRVLRAVGSRIQDMKLEQISVPLGNVLLPALLSGRGGYIPVRLVAFETSGAELESRFASAGFNQTLHELSLRVSVNVTALTPAGELTVPVSVETVVAQTVIVGRVPQTLISIGE